MGIKVIFFGVVQKVMKPISRKNYVDMKSTEEVMNSYFLFQVIKYDHYSIRPNFGVKYKY